jgi:hypothetical protein
MRGSGTFLNSVKPFLNIKNRIDSLPCRSCFLSFPISPVGLKSSTVYSSRFVPSHSVLFLPSDEEEEEQENGEQSDAKPF